MAYMWKMPIYTEPRIEFGLFFHLWVFDSLISSLSSQGNVGFAI